MLNNEQILERCRRAGPLTCEEIGIPKWMKDTDGVVYICGGFTLYKTSKGYRHQTADLQHQLRYIVLG